MDDTREDMCKLIDVIEKGAKSTSVEQAMDDIKLFSNTTSFLASALDTRLKSKDAKPKKRSKPAKTVGQPKPPVPSIPKPSKPPKSQGTTTGMPPAISTAISQADYDRLKPQAAQAPLGSS
jgi:transposase